MEQNILLIRKIPLLKSLTDEDILTNLRNRKFKITSYKKNSVVHMEGEACNKLEIILSGKVVVDRIDESGNMMKITTFYSDNILGGSLLFSRNPSYPMTVSTQLQTDILEVEKEVLFELFSNNMDFLRTYLELISDYAYILGNTIKHYVNRSLRASIKNYLQNESKRQQSKIIKLNKTKKALAEKFGVQRTSLSRELAKMREEGLIEYDSTSISLLK